MNPFQILGGDLLCFFNKDILRDMCTSIKLVMGDADSVNRSLSGSFQKSMWG